MSEQRPTGYGAASPGPSISLPVRLRLEAALIAAGLGQLRRALAERIYGTGLYRWILRGPMPDRLLRVPDDLWPGRPERAEAMMAGQWSLEGRLVTISLSHPFDQTPPSDAWGDALHGFGWLRDFHSLGGESADKAVRGLVREWISRHKEPGGAGPAARPWRAAVLARRMIAWSSHARMVLDSSDLVFRSLVLRAMVRQAAHLRRLARTPLSGPDRLASGIGLCFAGLVLPQSPDYLTQGLELVRAEAQRQILPDGGHISRSPECLLQTLADLVLLKSALLQARAEVPQAIQIAIDRATPMVRLLRHGDGGLCFFNDSSPMFDGYIDRVVSQADAKGRPLGLAPHMGFGRLIAKRSLVIMDMGPSRLDGAHGPEIAHAHAGCLSFEFSVGRHRIVTNCGSGRLLGADWERPARATAAHSTLTLCDSSQFQLLPERFARWFGLSPLPVPKAYRTILADRQEDSQGAVLDGAHDLYATRFRLRHARRIFIDPEGTDLRGEDTLEPAKGVGLFGMAKPKPQTPFAVRFHLHPDVRVSLARDGRSALLVLSNGDGWVFRASGAKLDLEESIYLGDPGGVRRTMQLVLTSEAQNGHAKVKWAFKHG